jgi:LPS O-antigen subunit length determinant protein (WzzB/FepE family)
MLANDKTKQREMWGDKRDATQLENATRPSKLPYALMSAGKMSNETH